MKITGKTRKFLYRLLGPAYRVAVNQLSVFDTSFQFSYSQEGEDLILRNLFRRQPEGFYVDVGAFHPRVFSNTYLFYRLGWRGINIDAMPGSMKMFRRLRPRDVNLECAISDRPGLVTLYQFNNPALNTFDEELAKLRSTYEKFSVTGNAPVNAVRLDTILSEYLPEAVDISFLNIDVEGYEISVLRSNNWNRFRPSVVLVELLDSDVEEVIQSDVHQYMCEQEYRLFSKTINTLIYVEAGFQVDSYA